MSMTERPSNGGGGGGTPQATHVIPAGWWQNLFPLGGEQARGNKAYPAATGTNKYVWCVPFVPENNTYEEFHLYFGLALVGDAEFGVYEVNENNHPTGTPLYTDVIPSGSAGAVYITMTTPWALTAGKKYVVALYMDSDNGSPSIRGMNDQAALTAYTNPATNISSCIFRMVFVNIASLALCDADTLDMNNSSQFSSITNFLPHFSVRSQEAV